MVWIFGDQKKSIEGLKAISAKIDREAGKEYAVLRRELNDFNGILNQYDKLKGAIQQFMDFPTK